MDAVKESCARLPDSPYVELAAEVFAMLADATRVRIILSLREMGEMSVNHLADVVDKSPAAVSQHLAKMRLARMVDFRQDGTRMFYRLADEHASDLVRDAIFQAEHALGGTPRHHHPRARPTVLPDEAVPGRRGADGVRDRRALIPDPHPLSPT